MEQMLTWILISRQFGKDWHIAGREAEDRYYQAFAGWSGSFRRSGVPAHVSGKRAPLAG